MDTHTLERLEYAKVLDRIAAHAMLPQGVAAVHALTPLPDHEAVRTRADRIAEGMTVLGQGHDFGVERFEDPTALLDRAAIEGAALAPQELQTVAAILRNADEFQKIFRRLRDGAPLLWKLASDLDPQPELLTDIERTIEPDGSVADNASPDLKRIRNAMHTIQDRIRQRLEHMVQDADLKSILTGDYVTQRNGRWVIPVASASAGDMPGIIHDRSDTGFTVFVEPQAVVHLGNELRGLLSDEEREVHRILRELTAQVRGHLYGLRQSVKTLVEFDLVRAAAKFGKAHRMVRPVFAADGVLRIVHGRHPVLEDSLAGAGGQVVPLDFEIGGPIRTIAITGANAGGKTVSLKTIGLLCLMAQTGLPVPADEGTAFVPLRRVLVDIGDEQSIEANLSTFSGHTRRVKEILEAADEHALVLLDEIGAGTDPVEGGALACAVIKALHGRGSRTVVTTHLSQIKGFVHEQAGMENASVEFDPETLKPTYRLIIGRPGASHALTIARRFGLPEEVIRMATELVDSRAIEMEGLLGRLTEQLKKAEADAVAARKDRAVAEEARKELENRLEELRRDRKETLRRAVEEARGLVENTRRELEQALRQAREAGADATATKEIRQRVEQKRERIKKTAAQLAPKVRGIIPLEQLEPGRRVWVAFMKRHGTVSRIDEKKRVVTVDAGGMTIEVEAGAVLEPDEATEPAPSPQGRTIVKRPVSVSPELDLRGQRVEEARRRLETYLNEAALGDMATVRIIHGFGTDAIRKMAHDLLDGYPLVASFRYGEKTEGGRGVTVVVLK